MELSVSWASTLATDLFALLITLKFVNDPREESLIVSDSQSSLRTSNSPEHDCNIIVSEARHKYNRFTHDGVRERILWLPSYVGLRAHA